MGKQDGGKAIFDSSRFGSVSLHDTMIESRLSENLIHISLPEIESLKKRDAIIKFLMDVYDKTPLNLSWVVNLSNLKVLPLLIIGVLWSHREALRKRGQELWLEGLSSRQVSPTLFEKLLDTFPVYESKESFKATDAS